MNFVDFLEKYGLACIFGFIFLFTFVLVLICVPWGGVDYQVIAYTAGDASCLLRTTEHRLFEDKISEKIKTVYELGDDFYVEIGNKYVEIEELIKPRKGKENK